MLYVGYPSTETVHSAYGWEAYTRCRIPTTLMVMRTREDYERHPCSLCVKHDPVK